MKTTLTAILATILFQAGYANAAAWQHYVLSDLSPRQGAPLPAGVTLDISFTKAQLGSATVAEDVHFDLYNAASCDLQLFLTEVSKPSRGMPPSSLRTVIRFQEDRNEPHHCWGTLADGIIKDNADDNLNYKERNLDKFPLVLNDGEENTQQTLSIQVGRLNSVFNIELNQAK